MKTLNYRLLIGGVILGFSPFVSAQTVSTFDVLVATETLTVVGTTTFQGSGFSVGGSTFIVTQGNVGIATATPTGLFTVGNGTLTVLSSGYIGASQLSVTGGPGLAVTYGLSAGSATVSSVFVNNQTVSVTGVSQDLVLQGGPSPDNSHDGGSVQIQGTPSYTGNQGGYILLEGGGVFGAGNAVIYGGDSIFYPGSVLTVGGGNNQDIILSPVMQTDIESNLSVTGSIAATLGITASSGTFIGNGGAQSFSLAVTSDPARSVYHLYVATTGMVGVGTSSPGTTLDVNGSAQFGQGVAKSTFTSVGALSLASGAALSQAGSGGYFTNSSSVTAAAFFGDGSHLSGITGTLSGGTTPQLPYWTGASSLGNSQIYRDSSQSITVVGATVTFQNGGGAPVSTRQILKSGSNQTYTTPANCRQLRIRMIGGGGGGGAQALNSNNGATGSSTTWITPGSTIAANGGSGGLYGQIAGGGVAGGTGGHGGSGVWASSSVFRTSGGAGGSAAYGAGSVYMVSGFGGSSALGGGAPASTNGVAGINAVANSGGGGGGAEVSSGGSYNGGGGGGGEYVELIINSPLSSYTYTVGAGGAGGAAGGEAGGNGGSGVIIVDELY